MATLEERVAYLEGQVSEHTNTLVDIRDSIRQLERRFDARFDGLDRRMTSIEEKLERRIEELDGKLQRRTETIEDKIERRTEALEDKMSRQFAWLVGIQVTTLVAIVGALLSRA